MTIPRTKAFLSRYPSRSAAAIMVVALGMVLLHPTERCIRLTGLVLQLCGILIAFLGISLVSKVRAWLESRRDAKGVLSSAESTDVANARALIMPGPGAT